MCAVQSARWLRRGLRRRRVETPRAAWQPHCSMDSREGDEEGLTAQEHHQGTCAGVEGGQGRARSTAAGQRGDSAWLRAAPDGWPVATVEDTSI